MTTNNSENYTFENNVILGSFISLEIMLLGFLVFEYYKISVAIIFFVLLLVFFYKFVKEPFAMLPIFLLAILAGKIELDSSTSFAFTDLLFPIIIFLLFIKLYYNQGKRISTRYNFMKYSYLSFLIWALLFVYWAADKNLAITYWRNYFAGFIVFMFAIVSIERPKQIKTFLVVLVLWGVILSLIEYYILFSLGGIPEGLVKLFIHKNALATSWGKSNYLSTFHVLIIPITTGLLVTFKSKKMKLVLGASLIIMVSAMILTLSRGGMLTLLFATILFISKVLRPKTLIPVLLIVSIAALLLLLNPLTMVIFQGIGTIEKNLSTFTRLNFYEDVWNTFLKYPVTGVGLGNLGYYSQFKITTYAASAHNIILGTLGETGIFGSILYMSTLLYAFLKSLRISLSEKLGDIKILQWSFFCAFIGVFAHSMIEPNFEGFQFAIMFWSTLGAFFKLSELNQEDKVNLFG